MGFWSLNRTGRCPAEGALAEPTAEPSTRTHLVDAALNDGEEGQGYCVETEENIIDGHRVHPAGITDQELLLKSVCKKLCAEELPSLSLTAPRALFNLQK